MADIGGYMRKLLDTYCLFRGKERNEFPTPFWDAVVITSSDSEQRKGFELQINSKKLNGELPLVHYYVLDDPPGIKIGSGGSTFHVLQFLKTTYGDSLSSLRILLIHGGGHSQRLPSHSLCGKLFSCVPLAPLNGPPWQMLDLKLATFIPFLKRMVPGIYITASDDIITYTLDAGWNFNCPGVTALAHPSSLDIGSTHGVYVLSESSGEAIGSCRVASCRTVLQKPSLKEMQQSGAICKCPDTGKEYVYSDSSFFVDNQIVELLLGAFPKLSPLTCETDVYGDFLQPLGTEPNPSYIHSNVTNAKEVARVRQGLYDLLAGKPLNILVLKQSCFYHIGTINELVFNWCNNKVLSSELGLRKQTCSLIRPGEGNGRIEGVLMQSIVNSDSVIGKECVLEYCQLEVPVVSEQAVLSGCALSKDECETSVIIPEKTMFFTCAVCTPYGVKWCCGALHFDDNVKASYESRKCGNVKFMGVKLDQVCSVLGKQSSVELFDDSAKSFSLWNARLFPVAASMTDAFLFTLEMVKAIVDNRAPSDLLDYSGMMLSLEDFVKQKSVKHMVDFRELLGKDIVQSL